MGAVTDSLGPVTYEPTRRPGVANLLEILSQCSSSSRHSDDGADGAATTPAALASDLAGARLGDLKRLVVDAIALELTDIRDRYDEVLHRTGGKHIDDIQAAGAEKARQNAAETMRIVRESVGLAAI